MEIKKFEPDQVLILMAVKLVQPGRLGDVTEGVLRLVSKMSFSQPLKALVREVLTDLKSSGYVEVYPVGRYILTEKGQSAIAASGAKANIDSRRFFLLKETRKNMQGKRSDTRNRPLQQRSS